MSPTNKSNHVWQVAKFICCRHICCEFHINTCFDRSIHFLPRLNLFCRLDVEQVLFQLVAHLVYVYTAYMNLFVHFFNKRRDFLVCHRLGCTESGFSNTGFYKYVKLKLKPMTRIFDRMNLLFSPQKWK